MSWTTLKRYLVVLCIINFNLEYQTSGSNVIKYEVTIFPAFAKRILEGEVISSANNTLYIAVLQQTIPFLSNDLLSITAEVEMVSFVYCQIKEIEKDCFRNQNVVKQIVICMNEISVIRRRTFANLQIESLSLENNLIKVVENEAFFNLTNLRHIFLNTNQISQIDPKCFVQVSQLSTFDVSMNRIKKLQNGFLEFIRTDNILIDLSCNPIRQIDRNAFDGLIAQQVTLNLGKILIKTLPAGVFNNHSFTTINLEETLLKSISGDICTENCVIEELYLDFMTLKNSGKEIIDWSHKHDVTLESRVSKARSQSRSTAASDFKVSKFVTSFVISILVMNTI
jgi:hypothetical protein